MPIIFSAIAHNGQIKSKFASCEGNFSEILNEVIVKIPKLNNKMTLDHGRYLLHYVLENQHLYFCITDKTCQRSRAFLFLNEIRRKWISNAKCLNSDLAVEMKRYSEDYNTITIRKGELDELNNIGVECSETILGGKLLYVHNPETVNYFTVAQPNESPQQSTHSNSSGSKSIYYILIFITVILIIWLAFNYVGRTSLVTGCIFILFIFKLVRQSNKE